MALRYQPDKKAIELAEKALSMKISVQAVLDAIDEEKQKYRQRMGFVLDAGEETILHHADPDTPDDELEDLKVDAAVRDRDVLGDVEETLERIYGPSERGLELLREEIEAKVLAAIHIPTLLANAESQSDCETAISKMIDIAVWQAMALLEWDEYENAGLVTQAVDIIKDRLGHTRN